MRNDVYPAGFVLGLRATFAVGFSAAVITLSSNKAAGFTPNASAAFSRVVSVTFCLPRSMLET